MNLRRCSVLAALAGLVTLAGCNSSGPVPVTGRLTYKGNPVPSTMVTFIPDDGGRPSHGVTDDDGKFALKYSRNQMGVTRGGHAVFLKYDVSMDEELHKIQPKAGKELKAVIAKYSDPKTSGLHYDVTESGQFIEIRLE
jgi:hypothetical protein